MSLLNVELPKKKPNKNRKVDVQSLCMLGSIAGCFNHLYTHRYFSRVDIHQLCHDAYKRAADIVKDWPTDGGGMDLIIECMDIVHDWGFELEKYKDKSLPARSVIFVASSLLAELQDTIRNPAKRKYLTQLDKPIAALENFTDPNHDDFIANDHGKNLLDFLYDRIGWEYKKTKKKRRK